ncbi:type II toxin-antitoxin system prevent-host-death family antitoxin [Rhizobium sp. MC63]|uniref:Type II toxin-antitoxin system prevent-host-death family antitoxin n=1 Tax=Rhizobium mulingense TaxID=3031128 RepID=A0ACC6MT65_9HYPH|nr:MULTISPECIES: type II toxin-antitoxin system prevent-host-death family antitoxin [unclassified Rhizobium]MDF0696900.1 type II toxin-antitoxin system prevent-host-death family antitoxin [Rhizobium sp. MC63]MEA3516566.1 type II toxin-antitoxin system prevent-host-death family antitoxin [Rhizobium sp. MJ31]
MQVTIPAAKANLLKLIDAALSGEEVVIAKGRKPVVKLVPVVRSSFQIGLLKGQVIGDGPDFFEPIDEGALAVWKGIG